MLSHLRFDCLHAVCVHILSFFSSFVCVKERFLGKQDVRLQDLEGRWVCVSVWEDSER